MEQPVEPHEALRNAVRLIGGQAATARLRGVSQPTVWYWLKTGKLPGEHVVPVSEETGIPPYHLRPDIFPAPTDQSSPPCGDAPPSVGPSGSIVACGRAAFSHRGDA